MLEEDEWFMRVSREWYKSTQAEIQASINVALHTYADNTNNLSKVSEDRIVDYRTR